MEVAFDWPPLLTAQNAQQYTQRSRWTINRAVNDGALTAAGQRGRTKVFRRADLDAWMLGPAPSKKETSKPVPSRKPTKTKSRANTHALERLRVLSGGKGKR